MEYFQRRGPLTVRSISNQRKKLNRVWDELDDDQIQTITTMLTDSPTQIYKTIKKDLPAFPKPPKQPHKPNLTSRCEHPQIQQLQECNGKLQTRIRKLRVSNSKMLRDLEVYRPQPLLKAAFPYGFDVKQSIDFQVPTLRPKNSLRIKLRKTVANQKVVKTQSRRGFR